MPVIKPGKPKDDGSKSYILILKPNETIEIKTEE
jgi:hypothetical protein